MKADIAIIGSGPAGIQAAIHAARAKASVVVLGKGSNSALEGTCIENYFGLGECDGTAMLKKGIEQAKSFGAQFVSGNVISAKKQNDVFVLVTENDETIESKAVIFATGVSRKKLNVPGEKELFGKGVSYCASCDCNFYKGRKVLIVGDDTEAAVSAELMTKYASKTYWITDRTIASDAVVEKARTSGAEIIKGTLNEISGNGKVESVTLSDGKKIDVDGVFIELGAKSSADLAMDLDVMPEMDDSIKVDNECSTTVKGVFACGDITGKPWQLAKAVGQGCTAGVNAAKYVKG